MSKDKEQTEVAAVEAVAVAPTAIITQAKSGHVKADIVIDGEVVKTYPIALSQGRFYFSINGSFGPVLQALALKAHESGRPGGHGEVQAMMLDVVATTLDVAAPGKASRKNRAVDWDTGSKALTG